MPANPKYLTKSSWHRFAKISAGILGGYIISALFHMVLSLYIPAHKEVLITSAFTLFILWGGLLLVPYLFRNGWKIWGIYLLAILLLYLFFYLGNSKNPFI